MSVMPGYSAAKAALHSFTQSLRCQLEDTTIDVFEVLPPPVDTQMVASFHMDKMAPEKVAEKILQGLRKGYNDISIGSVKSLRWMICIAPRFVKSLSHKLILKATKQQK